MGGCSDREPASPFGAPIAWSIPRGSPAGRPALSLRGWPRWLCVPAFLRVCLFPEPSLATCLSDGHRARLRKPEKIARRAQKVQRRANEGDRSGAAVVRLELERERVHAVPLARGPRS